jgi:alcohol dehydrogenase class IV
VVDGNGELLAGGVGVGAATPGAVAGGRVGAGIEVRDALELSTRLREISDMDESDLPAIAEDVHEDGLMPYCPEGLDPTVDELEGVLRDAW